MAEWYCKIDGVEHGPLSQKELVKMAENGRLSPDDLVRNNRKKKWYKARQVHGLKLDSSSSDSGEAASSQEPASESPGGSTPDDSVRSAEVAMSLLKGLQNSKRSKSDSGEVNAEPSDRVDDDDRPKSRKQQLLMTPSRELQAAEAAGFSRSEKITLAVTALVMLVFIALPPHTVPENVDDRPGRHTSPWFAPPSRKVDVADKPEEQWPSDILKEEPPVTNEQGKITKHIVIVEMPIAWGRLALELAGILLVGAAVFGILRVRRNLKPYLESMERAEKQKKKQAARRRQAV